jgi:3-oxoacyl-[acyl-carrier protein] reductase
MNISLLHKTAIICGSSQGIGLACAKQLALQGATCILMARNEESLKNALLLLDTSHKQQHSFLVANFDEPTSVLIAIENFVAKGIVVEILINNSGGPAAGPIANANIEDFSNTFNRHLICNHILAKALIPAMKQAGYGRIVNIISTSVKVPLHNLGVSNTIRGAVANWGKSMANELGQFNITVNNVLPGATNTNRLQNIIATNATKKDLAIEAIEAEMLHEIPMKRFAQPSEIANAVAFLASPAAGYINGINLPVDGGRTGAL